MNAHIAGMTLKPIAPYLIGEIVGYVEPKRAAEPTADRETVLCWDPWWIARTAPNCEALAKKGLEREGFEVYYPRGKTVRAIPKNQLPSKTRHKRRYEFRESYRSIFTGYVFLRRLTGHFELFCLHEIPHVAGVCTFGGAPAAVEDYVIERIRAEEARGEFDDYDGRSIKNGQHLTPIESDRRWTGETKLRGALVHCGRIIYFVERFGRVTRFMQGYHASAKL